MKRSATSELDSESNQLLCEYFTLYMTGKRREASVVKKRLAARLKRLIHGNGSVLAAIALGDISMRTDSRYRAYKQAVDLSPLNVEALSHLALEAALLHRDSEARLLCRRAIRIGFAGYSRVADLQAQHLWIAARLIGEERLAKRVQHIAGDVIELRDRLEAESCLRERHHRKG